MLYELGISAKSTPNRANDRNLPILIFDLKSTNSEKIDFDRLWKAEATVTGMGMELSSLSISRLIEFFQAGEKQSTNIELKASLREVLIDIKNVSRRNSIVPGCQSHVY